MDVGPLSHLQLTQPHWKRHSGQPQIIVIQLTFSIQLSWAQIPSSFSCPWFESHLKRNRILLARCFKSKRVAYEWKIWNKKKQAKEAGVQQIL